MWADRLRGNDRFEEAVRELWPYALAVLDEPLRPRLVERTGLSEVSGFQPQAQRGTVTDELRELWEEMTMVRRSVVGAAW
jgi:hypothetical protein